MGRKKKTEPALPCSVEGCGRPTLCRSLCVTHYHRKRKSGEIPLIQVEKRRESLDWLRGVVASDDSNACIEWPFGAGKDGYGQVAFMGRTRTAHRVALMLKTGMYGVGLEAAHKPVVCHNPMCCNPVHLRWATRSDNERDKLSDGTVLRGEQCGSSKLTNEQAKSILSDNRKTSAIAADYGIGEAAVSRIKRGATWRHLQPVETA